MDSFRFAPELFEYRNRVLAKLEAYGFEWLGQYASVSVLHDTYGIEVDGIGDKEDALRIQEILSDMFPTWFEG